MGTRTALRLDPQAEADLQFLAEIYGTQTAAMKSALAALAERERRFAAMREFIADTEIDSGELTESELEAARDLFR